MQFKNIYGQSAAKEKLIRAVADDRIAHAQLIAGPKGSMGLAIAFAYAQFLNCEHRGADDSCGHCGSCYRAAKMVHPDIHYSYPVVTTRDISKPKAIDFIDKWRELAGENPYLGLMEWLERINEGEVKSKQGLINVEEVNDIIRKISLKSFEGKFKIVIIWLPEKMNAPAANKLLKNLEEPPGNTIFLMVSEEADQLLPTILSRTQQIRLQRPSLQDIQSGLKEMFDISSEKATKMAMLSDHNFSEAVRLAESDGNDFIGANAFLEWMRLCFNPQKTFGKLITWVEGMASQNKEEQKQFLLYCSRMVRECMVLNADSVSLSRLDEQEKETLSKFRSFINIYNVGIFMTAMDESAYYLERNAAAKILFLDLSFRISGILKIKEEPAEAEIYALNR